MVIISLYYNHYLVIIKKKPWMSGFYSGNELEHIQENLVAPVEKLCADKEAPAGLMTFIHHGVKAAKQKR